MKALRPAYDGDSPSLAYALLCVVLVVLAGLFILGATLYIVWVGEADPVPSGLVLAVAVVILPMGLVAFLAWRKQPP
jgi:hypothetical protein